MSELASADLDELVGYPVAYHEPVSHGKATVGGAFRIGTVVKVYGTQAVTVRDAVGIKLRVPLEHILGVYYGDRAQHIPISTFLDKKRQRALNRALNGDPQEVCLHEFILLVYLAFKRSSG